MSITIMTGTVVLVITMVIVDEQCRYIYCDCCVYNNYHYVVVFVIIIVTVDERCHYIFYDCL